MVILMKYILKNTSYDIYLIFLGTLAFFSFVGKFDEYILLAYIGIAFLLVIAKKGIFYIIPIPIFMTMSMTSLRNDPKSIIIYGVIFIIIFLIDSIRNRKFTRVGYLFIPFVIYIILSIITSVNSPDGLATAIGFALCVVMAFIYLYFLNTLEPGEENYIKLSKMVMYLAVLVSVQMLYQVVGQGELAIEFVSKRRINLEWENLNLIIYVNLISIPFIGYLISKYKVKLPYMILSLIVILGIILTLSRSSILTVGVYVVVLLPLIFFLEKDKMSLIIQALFAFLVVVIGVYYLEQQSIISDIIKAIIRRDWTNAENRTELLVVAIEQFKLHPLLGSGGLYSSSVHLIELGPLNYHNTFAQASSLGILGLLAFIFLFFRKTKLIMLSKSSFKWFALIMIYITAFVNGMFQPMYFYTTYMIYIIMVLCVVEVNIKGSIKGM